MSVLCFKMLDRRGILIDCMYTFLVFALQFKYSGCLPLRMKITNPGEE